MAVIKIGIQSEDMGCVYFFLMKHHELYMIIYRPEVHVHSSEVKGCNPFQKPVRANEAASHSHNSTNLIVRN